MKADNLNLGGQYNLDNFARIIREANDRLTGEKLTAMGVIINSTEREEIETSISEDPRLKVKHARSGRNERNSKYVKNYFKQKLRKTLGL
jgi:hypothetical protein